MIQVELTKRDVELIEVALESAISACVGISPGRDDELAGLAGEYRQALTRVRQR